MGDKSWMKPASDKHSVAAYGKVSEGYSAVRKDQFESDAKAMAGREKREMQALFGNKPAASHSTGTAKKFEGGSSALPSMFTNVNSGGGLNATMKQTTHSVFDPTTGGSKTKPTSNGTVSKLNMGSAATMDKTRSQHVDVANRANFAKSAGSSTTSSSSSTSKATPPKKGLW